MPSTISLSSSFSSSPPPHHPPQPSSASPPPFSPNFPKKSRKLYWVLVTSLVALLLILSFSSPSPSTAPNFRYSTAYQATAAGLLSSLSQPPSLAYLITGSAGDGGRLIRLLHAVYHPKNLYLLHLDGTAPKAQLEQIALAVRAVPAFRSARNVHVIGKQDFANPRGSSVLSATLHGAAILLRLEAEWDWFINLDASDYPLVAPDDLLHVFSFLPRDLNFVQHSSYIGWRESRRIRPIIVDPGLYLSSRSDIFYATQKRQLPDAYKFFTGSASVILSRKFVEFCILGTDNLARTVLMYYANTPSSHTDYFQTLLCNSPRFNKTVVNNQLHYMVLGTTGKREPRDLTIDDFNNMTISGAAYGTRFAKDDPVLDQIDKQVLNRNPEKIVPGGWCLGRDSGDPCTIWGNVDVLSPGPVATMLAKLISELLSDQNFHSNQCLWH